MASNPMQKKSRNSFLLGMLLMLIISAAVIIALVMIMQKNNKKQEEEEQKNIQKYVYALAVSVNSGEEITDDKLKLVVANEGTFSEDAFGSIEMFSKEIINSEGEYMDVAKYRSKLNLSEGTILSESMLYEGEALDSSERIQEYNMFRLPIQLEVGDYIDVRYQITNGQDYIVLSHKEVIDVSEKTIWLKMTEAETLLMSNAIVDAYISPTTNLYVVKYVEPGLQDSAVITYVPSEAVRQMIKDDANIVSEAKEALDILYRTVLENGRSYREYYRAWMDANIILNEQQAISNIQSNMTKSREEARAERQKYLSGAEE